MNYLRILSALENNPWAITSNAMETILSILAGETTPEAVAAKLGRPLENTGGRVTMRGQTAILEVSGPLFRRANLFTEVSGATSVETLSTAFHTAINNSNVKQVVLEIDSPGGEVNGILQLADMIREGSAQKPVYAYVDGMAASGGYWLASAASKVIADESAILGSIGVVATIRDNRAAMERQGVRVHEIVSSQSPYKRPDPATDDGRAQILEIVNSTADLFIGRVAKFRGVSADTVLAKFGQGKSMLAHRALDAGMVDKVGGFEAFLASFDEGATKAFSFAATGFSAEDLAALRAGDSVHIGSVTGEYLPVISETTPKENSMSAPNLAPNPAAPAPAAEVQTDPKVIEAAVTAAITADRTRMAGILACDEAKGREALANHLAFKGESIEDAKKTLALSPVSAPGGSFAARMALVPNPQVGAGGEKETMTAQDEANAMLQFVPRTGALATRRKNSANF